MAPGASLALAHRGWNVALIDNSTDQLQAAKAAAGEQNIKLLVVEAFSLTSECPPPIAGAAAAFTSAGTLNCFVTEEAVAHFLRCASTIVESNGHLFLPVFDDPALQRFERTMTGQIYSHVLRRGEETSVIWTALCFDLASAILRQPCYTSTVAGDRSKHYMCVSEDRIWTPSALIPLIERSPWTLKLLSSAEVQGGGASGWPFRMMVLANDGGSSQ